MNMYGIFNPYMVVALNPVYMYRVRGRADTLAEAKTLAGIYHGSGYVVEYIDSDDAIRRPRVGFNEKISGWVVEYKH